MESQELLHSLLQALREHIPSGPGWTPVTLTAAAGLLGLILMLRGARFAPAVVALGLTIGGGFVGSLVSNWAAIPLGPALCAGIGGVAGLILSLALFRLWIALQVAALLVAAALALYSTRLAQPLSTFVSKEYDPQTQQVTLLAPEELPPQQQAWHTQAADLWAYLGEQVPAFQISFFAIVVSAALAGLVFAGLMPKAARSFWAATLGTGLFVASAWFVLYALAPPELLERVGPWGPTIAGTLWCVSLLANLIDLVWTRKPKPREDEPKAKPRTA